jgi:hypothetical protein
MITRLSMHGPRTVKLLKIQPDRHHRTSNEILCHIVDVSFLLTQGHFSANNRSIGVIQGVQIDFFGFWS